MRNATTRVVFDGPRPRFFRRKFALQVLAGPDQGHVLTTAKEVITAGASEQNDLVLTDSAISRHHLRIESTAQGYAISDLDSTNGTFVGQVRIKEIVATKGVELHLGETVLRLIPLKEEEEVPLHNDDRYGELLGRSASMREMFREMSQVSKQDVTVLIEGETGTGKEMIAQEIHRHSPRRKGPFIIVDCGAIPPTLMESELFGHVRGSFTGATSDRAGAFEEANGGTIFLDEIGELDLAMQPRLLRVLEQRQVKRVGEAKHRNVDMRVISATNRDLQRMVNQGTFRADLFYRLKVMHLRVPPLRQRPEDVELLIERMLPEVAARVGVEPPPQLTAETVQQMISHPWPGNVRELRNFLERLVTLSSGMYEVDPLHELKLPAPSKNKTTIEVLENLPFKEAKARYLVDFELQYLNNLLKRCQGNVAEAARQSGIDRVHLFRLIKKYQLKK